MKRETKKLLIFLGGIFGINLLIGIPRGILFHGGYGVTYGGSLLCCPAAGLVLAKVICDKDQLKLLRKNGWEVARINGSHPVLQKGEQTTVLPIHGSSVSEAMEEAQEALSAYLLTLLEEGRAINAPSDTQNYHPADGFPTLVSCQVEPQKSAKAVKKTLTIPAWLNERATAMGLNFSKVLQEALISKIQA